MLKYLKILLVAWLIILCFIGMFLFESIDTLIRLFPLNNFEAVLFTLTHDVGGTKKFMWVLLEPCLKPAVISFVEGLFLIVSVAILFSFIRLKKDHANLQAIIKNSSRPIAICVGAFCLVVWISAFLKFPLLSYAESCEAFLDNRPIYNMLYEKDYIHPDSIHIKFEKKKNLILIISESMESNFQKIERKKQIENLVPEITELAKTNISFAPGGITVEGTGWTMSESVAKTCGIPLQEPIGYKQKDFYLRNVVCLTDILHRNGYEIKFSQGTDISFASMDLFLLSHGIKKENIYDLQYFENKGIPFSDPFFLKSIKDSDLYEEAKHIISDLEKQYTPWAFWFFTIDTHGPYGRIDSNCIEIPQHIERKQQYPFALRCASKLIKDFIEWAKMQEWFENTTIVFLGDHPAMIDPMAFGFPQKEVEHYWVNFFVNSEIVSVPSRDRHFTSFDMFPTILEAMGVKIEGRALGLGRSLFSEERTLIEKYGKDSLDVLIKKKGKIHNSFWN